jgi:pimeloyl-ACP methyl ester carboxylesterase
VTQDALVFPGAGRGDRGLPPLPGLSAGTLQRADGESFRIVTVERGPARAVALYFVGNGEDLYSAASTGYLLAGYGLEVIGVEYPGYGASPGSPSVATVLGNADAAAARARARARELDVPLVVIGSSLGSCCAVHVAAAGGVDRLVLRAPLASLVATAQRRFPWLPVTWFLRHRFDNLARAPAVRCPVLVVHGDRDDIVPLESGRELAAAIGDNAELVVAAGYGHNDLSIAPDAAAAPGERR